MVTVAFDEGERRPRRSHFATVTAPEDEEATPAQPPRGDATRKHSVGGEAGARRRSTIQQMQESSVPTAKTFRERVSLCEATAANMRAAEMMSGNAVPEAYGDPMGGRRSFVARSRSVVGMHDEGNGGILPPIPGGNRGRSFVGNPRKSIIQEVETDELRRANPVAFYNPFSRPETSMMIERNVQARSFYGPSIGQQPLVPPAEMHQQRQQTRGSSLPPIHPVTNTAAYNGGGSSMYGPRPSMMMSPGTMPPPQPQQSIDYEDREREVSMVQMSQFKFPTEGPGVGAESSFYQSPPTQQQQQQQKPYQMNGSIMVQPSSMYYYNNENTLNSGSMYGEGSTLSSYGGYSVFGSMYT